MNINKIVKSIFERDQFIEKKKNGNLRAKLILQFIIAFSFLVLSCVNLLVYSYEMLVFTLVGFATNALFAFISYRLKSAKLSSYTSIITCSVLFASFVINGGNDGFACLWVILVPLVSMIILDFKCGLAASIFFQLFLCVVFWTPLNSLLLYAYNEQFCLRFPLFFFVTLMLGLSLTISLQQSEYNEYIHLNELEELNKKTLFLSRIDPLTKLANRRFSYEELNRCFSENGIQHCIVMGDIDDFKQVNDLYGHEFGDEVLITISNIINEVLPKEYLKSRWGGEEFLFASNEALDVVYERVEKLRNTIAEYPFKVDSKVIRVTMTFGIADYTDIAHLTETINLADRHLYIGKSKDKNCTIIEE